MKVLKTFLSLMYSVFITKHNAIYFFLSVSAFLAHKSLEKLVRYINQVSFTLSCIYQLCKHIMNTSRNLKCCEKNISF